MPTRPSFYDVLTEAVAALAEHGYDSAERLEYWMRRLRDATAETLSPPHVLDEMLRQMLAAAYRRLVERGEIARYHPGVARFTLDRVRPHLRAELDRRILASANLIKLNREEMVEKTLRRFAGWATSIPKGGSDAVARAKIKEEIRKPLARLPFEERRVLIDQNAKLRSALSDIIATDGGAIAGVWHSHWRQVGYNYREEHKERDGLIYAVRGCWALEQGLMKVGPAGYTDEITKPGEEVFCRCWYTWIYALARLPDEMLTRKGREALEAARERRAA